MRQESSNVSAPVPRHRGRRILESLRSLVGGPPPAAEERVVLLGNGTWSASERSGAVSVQCAAGMVWLTRERDSEDYVIGAGGTVTLAGTGKFVLMGMAPRSDVVVRRLASRSRSPVRTAPRRLQPAADAREDAA